MNLPDTDVACRPLAEYLTEFERDVALGLASRTRKGRRKPTPKEVAIVVQRVPDVVAGCEFVTPADLNDAAPAKLARYLDARTKLARRDGGLSAQSAAFFHAAARRFVWWLSARGRVPARADLFDGLPGIDPSSDRRHARRDVTPQELAAVLAAGRSSPKAIRGMTGVDRYHLYLTAFATGFRAEEVSKLRPESFDLDATPPTATLPARVTKNRKAARQPLPPGVASQLRLYVARKTAGKAIWPSGKGGWHKNAAELLKRDLAAAGVTYRVDTADG